MKNNKNKKIFIILIILIVLILLVGAAFAIFATDIFKSNKDLFFEYASQIFDENGFIESKLDQYNEKKKTNTFENEGILSASVESENSSNLNISFAGNTDNLNNKKESLVKINYTDDVNFPIYYKKVNGLHGIKMSDIAKGYFAVQEDEIGELISKFSNNGQNSDTESLNGISFTFSIGSYSLDLSSIKLTNEEKDKLKNTYLEVVRDSIDKSNFTKLKTMESEGYSLEISNKEIKDVIVKVLETLQNDDLMLGKLTRIFGTEIYAENIQSVIDTLNETEINEGNTTITVFAKNKKLNKIEIKFNDEIKLSISKKSSEDEISYTIELEKGNEFFISFDVKYNGLQNLEKVNEMYDISLTLNDSSYYYNFKNEIRFNEDIEISDFKEKEYADLNKFDSEKLISLLQGIGSKVYAVNERKMEEANLTGENPVISVIPGLSQVISNVIETQEQQETTQNNNENNENLNNTDNSSNQENSPEVNNTQNNTTENNSQNQETSNPSGQTTTTDINAGMEQLSMQSFNDRIKQYEGQNVKGPTVKSLMMQIIASNMAYEDKKIEVTGDIALTGDEVPDTIDSTKYYTVKCFTGSDGYINKVEVKVK